MTADQQAATKQFRLIALLEGISYLCLLLIGVPLKHLFHIPQPTRILGSIHGVLTLLFIFALIRVATECAWPLRRSATAFFLSLVPFGFLPLSRRDSRDHAPS